MKKRTTQLVLLFTGFFSCYSISYAKDITIRKITNCDSFHVEAMTTISLPVNILSRGRNQTIYLYHRNSDKKYKINMLQKRTITKNSKIREYLDGLAFTWKCVYSDFGSEFLFVDFVCANEDARSCSVAMVSPQSEWTNVYTSRGRLVTSTLNGLWPSQVKRLRKLGLWSGSLGSRQSGPSSFVYE